MSKIMLVEDDNNLREIYGARLQAEGYEIVSAQDGEEALALAVKEKPDLIISDVMMPRISGFDMLDILRNAPETKNTKVIMMTALSQAEDKSRADKLGADRYLVKSQVTLEDVANVVHEVLGDAGDESSSAEAEDTEAAPAAVSEESVKEAAPAETASVEPTVPATDIQPAPAVPDAIAPAQPEPETPKPTVDAIANPEVEVAGENDAQPVQAPPADPETAVPETVTPQSTTAMSASDDASMQSDDNLPPIVEPSSIKVELPSMAGNTPTVPEPPKTDDAAVPPAPETAALATEAPKTDFVGPSLAEALASEEQTTTAESSAQNPPTDSPPSDNQMPSPSIVNGVDTNTVIEPTKIDIQTPAESAPELPSDPTVVTPTQPPPAQPEEPEHPSTSMPAVGGERVIQPINDAASKPDINELLAAEERKAAVDNPAANTVITPGGLPPSTGQPQSDQVAKQKNDDLDNISL